MKAIRKASSDAAVRLRRSKVNPATQLADKMLN
jgi:hypothetical protein